MRRSMLPPSPQENLILALNLLRLLVQNRIAEFHTDLELIPAEVKYTAFLSIVATHKRTFDVCISSSAADTKI